MENGEGETGGGRKGVGIEREERRSNDSCY